MRNGGALKSIVSSKSSSTFSASHKRPSIKYHHTSGMETGDPLCDTLPAIRSRMCGMLTLPSQEDCEDCDPTGYW
eukprot:5952739-Prymnesium_polylepis.1